MSLIDTIEYQRLQATTERRADWKRWGPYLSDRAWGTVREDYSANGAAWEYLPHDHARSRAYRWNEDGLGGLCDRQQILCFAVTLWNGQDPILKERFFGLTGNEGNHGEDVKEYYFYLDSTPTHSYLKMLYKYPQARFPYEQLIEENRRRDRDAPEFELLDTGIFHDQRYFDVFIEYAKASPDDVFIKITITNRGPAAASLHVLPQLWFRNTWSWVPSTKPQLRVINECAIGAQHPVLGERWFYCNQIPTRPKLLFTENETNKERLWGVTNDTPYVKDAFHEYVIQGDKTRVNPRQVGTKAAAHYALTIGAGETITVQLRLSDQFATRPFEHFETVFDDRRREADEFYAAVHGPGLTADERNIQRQALAGLLWSKQWYHYDVSTWLQGDPVGPRPPAARLTGRNSQWPHVSTQDILSMPDKWEYPWFAAWDLAFHCIPLAMIDPAFAKRQLILMLREWTMHPNGQLPAYEWALGDVNPPVHAWAAWRVYQIDQQQTGVGDTAFLERVFHKLLLNFTWWVNRKDAEGMNVFQGGFLGLDNIGVFDRSAPLPTGGHIEQSDGTSWMGMYCLNLMTIALELARTRPAYEDVATKFFEHFMYIASALNNLGGEGIELWDAEDEFFYDVLHLDRTTARLKVRSLVGLIPLLAVETIAPDLLDRLPRFKRRMDWFLTERPDLASLVSQWEVPGQGECRLLALLRGHRLKRVLKRMLDPTEFLADYGVRALSKYHERNPYVLRLDGQEYRVAYEPAESRTSLFGGNSNWRGPIWFPVNYLFIEALHKFHAYYSADFRVESPTGSGQYHSLHEIAHDLSQRLIGLFLRDANGRRPIYGGTDIFQTDPHWRDYVLFHEYFNGDNGAGLGASHQTGWTALVAKLIQQSGGHRS
jgi:hypothetical protein